MAAKLHLIKLTADEIYNTYIKYLLKINQHVCNFNYNAQMNTNLIINAFIYLGC